MNRKHDLTVKSNGIINFQLGLITSMILVIFFLNLKTVSASPIIPPLETEPPNTPFSMTEVRVEKKKIEQPKLKKPKKRTPSPQTPTTEPDDAPDQKNDDFLGEDEPTTSEPVFQEPVDDEDIAPVLMNLVERVPVFPGCETMTDNEGRIQCLSDNISKIIQQYFNADLGADLGLRGEQVIYTTFSIDQQGEVVKIRARATHKKLEEEAKRVISKIPVMTPGNHNGKSVEVLYSVPIRLNIQ